MPRACPLCGSRKWRRDAVTGSAVCEEGHVLQGFRSENLVVEATSFAMTKRILKREPRRNKRKEAGDVNLEYYHGNDAELLKLQALQLLLRLQVQALSKLWSLPDAYEMIVRDLWAYQLAIHSTPSPPDLNSSSKPHPPLIVQAESGDESMAVDDVDEKGSSSSKASDDSTEKDGGSEVDINIDPDLLEEISNSSSDKEEELRELDREQQPEEDNRWKRRRRLRISDTVVTLILGLWVLRYPVLNVEIECLINDNRIPYLDFAHSTALPLEMFKHMNRDVALALAPSRSPHPLTLFNSCRKFARALSRGYEVIIPDINLPSLAWAVISSLGGSPTTYAQSMRLLALVDLNTSLLDSEIQTFTRRNKGSRPDSAQKEKTIVEMTRMYQDVILPEVAVSAAWAVVMKMTFGLDEEKRHVLLSSDPALGLPEQNSIVDELRQRRKSTFRSSMKDLENHDFAAMPFEDIDRFLTKCETVLLTNRPDDTSVAEVFPMIPSETIPPEESDRSWTAFYDSHYQFMKISSDIDVNLPNKSLPPMPGEKIKSYDAGDVTGTLPETFEVVCNSAAEVAGVDVEVILEVVEILERRLDLRKPGSLGREWSE